MSSLDPARESGRAIKAPARRVVSTPSRLSATAAANASWGLISAVPVGRSSLLAICAPQVRIPAEPMLHASRGCASPARRTASRVLGPTTNAIRDPAASMDSVQVPRSSALAIPAIRPTGVPTSARVLAVAVSPRCCLAPPAARPHLARPVTVMASVPHRRKTAGAVQTVLSAGPACVWTVSAERDRAAAFSSSHALARPLAPIYARRRGPPGSARRCQVAVRDLGGFQIIPAVFLPTAVGGRTKDA